MLRAEDSLLSIDKEQGVRLSVPKIYEILKEKYVIRSKWKKNRRRGPVPRARGPRQVVQMDTVMLVGCSPSQA